MMHVKRNKEMEIKKEKPAAEKRTSERRHRETKKGLTVVSLMKNPAIQTIFWFIVCLLVFAVVLLIRAAMEGNKEWTNPYIDVNENMWSYPYITELNKREVLPDSEKFGPAEPETRGNLILYLYNMDSGVFKKRDKLEPAEKKETPVFTDVTKDSELYDAVVWGYKNGLVTGLNETT